MVFRILWLAEPAPYHRQGLEEPLAINRPDMSAADRRAAAEAMMAKVGLRPDFPAVIHICFPAVSASVSPLPAR